MDIFAFNEILNRKGWVNLSGESYRGRVCRFLKLDLTSLNVVVEDGIAYKESKP